MDRPYEFLHTLTLLVMGQVNPILANPPTPMSLIMAYIDLGLKSKVANLNG